MSTDERKVDAVAAAMAKTAVVSLAEQTPLEQAKFKETVRILDALQMIANPKAIVFVQRRDDVMRVGSLLDAHGTYGAVGKVTGGNASSIARVMQQFREGAIKVVVTTCVLTRGIDVPQAAMVILYDLPVIFHEKNFLDKAEFLHRVGRVGRHGNRGVAVALVWDAHSDSVRLQEEAVISNVYTVAKALADRRTGGTGQVDPVKANFQIAPADEEELVKLLQDAISTDGGEAKYADPVVYYPGMDASFSPAFEWSDPRLGMPEAVISRVKAKGWARPADVQAITLPIIRTTNHNIIVQSPAGSGKTGCFALAQLLTVASSVAGFPNTVQCVCVTPTHLLTGQVASVIAEIGQGTKVVDLSELSRTQRKIKNVAASIVVGTPEATRKLTKSSRSGKAPLDLSKAKLLVIDEADFVASNNKFAPAVIDIKKRMPKDARVMLFSATYDEEAKADVQATIDGLLGKNPAKIVIPPTMETLTCLVGNVNGKHGTGKMPAKKK